MKELLRQFRLALIGIFLLLALSLLAIFFPLKENLTKNVQENYIHEGEVSLLSISSFVSHCVNEIQGLATRPMICAKFAAYTNGDISFEKLAKDTQEQYNMNLIQFRDCIAAIRLMNERTLAHYGKVDTLPPDNLSMYLAEETKVFLYEQGDKSFFMVSSPVKIEKQVVAYDIALFDPSIIIDDLNSTVIQHRIIPSSNEPLSSYETEKEIYVSNDKTILHKEIPGVNAVLELSADNRVLYEPVRKNTQNHVFIIIFSLLVSILLMRYLVYARAKKLMLELLESKEKVNNEVQRLRSLHEIINRIAIERNNRTIFQLVADMFIKMDFLAIAIYKTIQEQDRLEFNLLEESGHWEALLNEDSQIERLKKVAHSRTMQIDTIDAGNSSYLIAPIIIGNYLFGIFCARKKEFSEQDIDILFIIANYLAIFWELNNLIATTEQEALVDPLTMVWNRRYIMRRIKEEDKKLTRHGGEACIAVLDLGNLKPINDRYGHSIGDKILKAIASAIETSIRGIDVVGRLGGDEFLVLFPNTTLDEAKAALDRISLKIVEQKIDMLDIDIIADFGVASCPNDASSLIEALDIADDRMYAYKRKRKEKR